jgi:hypothetical protein
MLKIRHQDSSPTSLTRACARFTNTHEYEEGRLTARSFSTQGAVVAGLKSFIAGVEAETSEPGGPSIFALTTMGNPSSVEPPELSNCTRGTHHVIAATRARELFFSFLGLPSSICAQ